MVLLLGVGEMGKLFSEQNFPLQAEVVTRSYRPESVQRSAVHIHWRLRIRDAEVAGVDQLVEDHPKETSREPLGDP